MTPPKEDDKYAINFVPPAEPPPVWLGEPPDLTVPSEEAKAAEPVEEPADVQQPAVEAVAEIFEVLFRREEVLVSRLLAQLSRCTTEDLYRLFAPVIPAAPPPPEPPADERSEAEKRHDEFLAKPGHLRNLQQEPEEPEWDDNGNRISPKLPSAFPRSEARPLGTHWSS